MLNYKFVLNPYTKEPSCVFLDGVGFIPMDEGNMDYQAYLAWVAEGNTAEEWSPNGNQ